MSISAPGAGQMLTAKLVTALALIPGMGSMPVVATSENPAGTWLGDATMGTDGLIQITFHTLVGEQRYTFGPDVLRAIQFERHALHAWRLAFDHPHDGERCEFQAPPPADFHALLERLRS